MHRGNPKVSVIMACYNAGPYLDESIQSVLWQTLDDLELILVDDGSNDNTLEIAKRYEMQDQRISILSMPANLGPANARNVGIRVARGEWIGILDSDDVSIRSRFAEQIRITARHKDIVMIGSDCIFIDNQGRSLRRHKYPPNHQKLIKSLYSMQAFPPHSSMLYHRGTMQKCSGFNKRYLQSEDYDLWLRLSEAGKLASIDKALVKIRKHKQNISNANGGMLQVIFAMAACISHFLRVYGYPDPSVSEDEATWQRFLSWVKKRMIEKGFFGRRKAWIYNRSAYFAKPNRVVGVLSFGGKLLASGYAIPLLKEKMFGTNLPNQLAKEWIKNSYHNHQHHAVFNYMF